MNIQQALLRLRDGNSTLTFLEKEGGETAVRCGVLFEEALSLAGALQLSGVTKGGELPLQIDGVKNRILALWACWLGGFVPVSSAVFSRAEEREQLKSLCERHGNARFLTDLALPSDDPLALDMSALPRDIEGKITPMADGDAALLQYTSGTTDSARCAVLTGANLYESGVASSVVVRRGVRERYFNWLPLNHIFGIAAQHLVPLVNDFDQYHMSTARFVAEPALWARIITDYRPSVSGAAPFALELLRKNKALFVGADLSSMNVMFVGGGDLRAEPLKAFVEEMKPCGWRNGVLLPAYGLTEASMGVCYTPPGEGVTVHRIDPASAKIGAKIVFLNDSSANARALERVSLGVLDDCNEVEIRSDVGEKLPSEHLGSVYIRGTNVMRGYYKPRADEPANPDAEGWLDSGDLGFFKNGRLALFARKKDVIIHNSVNYARDDLEREAARAAGGAVALIEARGRTSIFAEGVSRSGLLAAARAISAAFGLPIAACCALSALPKTAKGAPDRVALAVGWESGEYDALVFTPDADETAGKPDAYERLAALWARALGKLCCNFGPDADFFALGGDSLKLIDLACLIEDETGAWLEPDELAAHPALADMAALIESKASEPKA